MDYLWNILLFAAAAVGGAVNSVAGGGSFLVFPALVFSGMPAIAANATTTMALWPGSVASAVAYRKLLDHERGEFWALVLTSMAGGMCGALILLLTPEQTFRGLIPWLLLVATLIFTFGKQLLARLPLHETPSPSRRFFARALQFIIGVYGGYFGAGIGILMLAMLQILGYTHIHRMNALKTVLGTAINGLAVGVFVLAGVIVWDKALLMLVGAVVGGWYASHAVQKVEAAKIRFFISLTGFLLTAVFFIKD